MEGKWIEVFKTGRHTDSAGNEEVWTEAGLDEIVANYNPSEHEAPVVIGHPEKDAPAYGWVAELKREGQILYAKLKQLVPEFVDMVKRGLFKKRSISLYKNHSYRLRHIGFLGAYPPAIKGLENIKFKEEEENIMMIYEFNENMSAGERLHQAILEFMDTPRGKGLNYTEAFNIVCREEKDLAEAYANELFTRPTRKRDAAFQERGNEISKKLDALTKEKMRENPGMSYIEAFNQVQIENRELAVEYAEFLGIY